MTVQLDANRTVWLDGIAATMCGAGVEAAPVEVMATTTMPEQVAAELIKHYALDLGATQKAIKVLRKYTNVAKHEEEMMKQRLADNPAAQTALCGDTKRKVKR